MVQTRGILMHIFEQLSMKYVSVQHRPVGSTGVRFHLEKKIHQHFE